MKHKSDVSSFFRFFHQMILTQFSTSIKVLRSNNGGEYLKQELKKFMNSIGIIHQTTCPYSSQQKGIAKRKNQQLLAVT